MLSSSSDFVSDFMWLLLFVIEVVERKEKKRNATLTLGDGGEGGGFGRRSGWLDGGLMMRELWKFPWFVSLPSLGFDDDT